MERLQQMSERFSLDKSHLSQRKCYVKFVNDSDEDVSVYWLDYQGNEVLYFENVQPGDSRQLKTFHTHPWVFKTSAAGEYLHVAYCRKLVLRFEVLNFMIDQFYHHALDLQRFQLQVQGTMPVTVSVQKRKTLLEISKKIILTTIGKRTVQADLKSHILRLELPKHLEEDLINSLSS